MWPLSISPGVEHCLDLGERLDDDADVLVLLGEAVDPGGAVESTRPQNSDDPSSKCRWPASCAGSGSARRSARGRSPRASRAGRPPPASRRVSTSPATASICHGERPPSRPPAGTARPARRCRARDRRARPRPPRRAAHVVHPLAAPPAGKQAVPKPERSQPVAHAVDGEEGAVVVEREFVLARRHLELDDIGARIADRDRQLDRFADRHVEPAHDLAAHRQASPARCRRPDPRPGTWPSPGGRPRRSAATARPRSAGRARSSCRRSARAAARRPVRAAKRPARRGPGRRSAGPRRPAAPAAPRPAPSAWSRSGACRPAARCRAGYAPGGSTASRTSRPSCWLSFLFSASRAACTCWRRSPIAIESQSSTTTSATSAIGLRCSSISAGLASAASTTSTEPSRQIVPRAPARRPSSTSTRPMPPSTASTAQRQQRIEGDGDGRGRVHRRASA